jgi:hypothetical protein
MRSTTIACNRGGVEPRGVEGSGRAKGKVRAINGRNRTCCTALLCSHP